MINIKKTITGLKIINYNSIGAKVKFIIESDHLDAHPLCKESIKE
tara:strand:- start:155 stop:289 length:135 start_codon:yes stop_codon:yes gene_type:complete